MLKHLVTLRPKHYNTWFEPSHLLGQKTPVALRRQRFDPVARSEVRNDFQGGTPD
jgi:hypothetical protein